MISRKINPKKTISGKILWYVLSIVVVTVGLTTVLSARSEYNLISRNMHRAAADMAEHVGLSVVNSFTSLNWVYVEKLLSEIMSSSHLDLIYVKVVNPANEVYLANSRTYYGQPVDPALLKEGLSETEDYFPETDQYGSYMLRPVIIGAETWHILLAYSDAPLKKALLELLYRNSAFGIFITLLGSLFSLILSRAITRPITDLVTVAGEVANGKWNTVSVQSCDEIGLLGQTFNRMITNIRSTTEALSFAKNQAEAANVAKGEFLANMSHEIRTPMNGVMGMTSLLLGSRLNVKQRKQAETISKSARSLLTIINDILDFSKIEAGKLVLHALDFNLHEVLGEAVDSLTVQAHKKNLELLCFVESDVPGLLQGDPNRLRQVIINLLSNGLKFTSEGEVVIRVHLVDLTDNEVLLKFSVTDTGIGISEQNQKQLFDSFTQVDGSSTRQYEGTGLGLAISKQLVTLMNGSIGVKSSAGQGAEFWFTAKFLRWTVPENENNVLPDAKAQSTRPQPDAYIPMQNREKKRRLLLVEDNEINQEVAVGLLESQGYTVDIANHGHEALLKLEERNYDLILMDCQMPVMDGYEATRKIRQLDSPTADIPIIAMTAHSLKGDRKKCIQIGMNDYIAKPLDTKILFATIHDWLPKDVQLSADRNGGKEQKKELSFDFSEMTTFSAAKGLSMLGGNEMLYVKFLQRFIATHGSNSGGIKELFEKGDLEEMQRYAHTVKGHAGQIGAESLQAVAKKLELSIAEREEALDSHLETFVASMDALCKEIEICLARL